MPLPAEPATRASSSQLTSPLRSRRLASKSDLHRDSYEIVDNSAGCPFAWMDYLPDAACLVDDSGVLIKHNHAFAQLAGFSPGLTDSIFKMWEEVDYAMNFHDALEKSHSCEGSFSFLIGFDDKLLSTEWWMSGHQRSQYFLITARNLSITPLYQLYKDMEEYRQLHEEMLRCVRMVPWSLHLKYYSFVVPLL